MKVKVDFDMCASTGGCMQICPEVFEVRNDGYLYVLQEEPAPELHDKVREAADLCPTAAIELVDVTCPSRFVTRSQPNRAAAEAGR